MGETAVARRELDSLNITDRFQHRSRLVSFLLARDNQRLITVTENNDVHSWDVGSGELLKTSKLNFAPKHIRELEQGQHYLVWSDTKAAIVNSKTLETTRTEQLPDLAPSWVVDSKGGLAVMGLRDEKLVSTLSESSKSIATKDKVRLIVGAPDGSMVACTEGYEKVLLLDPLTGELRGTIAVDGAAIKNLSVSDNGRFLVAYCEDNSFKVWNTQTRSLVFKIQDLFPSVKALKIADDGSNIVFSGNDKTLGIIQIDPAHGDVLKNQFIDN